MTVQRMGSTFRSNAITRAGRNIPLRIRDFITVSNYEADAIVTAIETWADA
jgi:hypothetical protein